MESRVCSVCGESKSLSAFSKDRRRTSGVAGKCQSCKNGHDWRVKKSIRKQPERSWTDPDHRVLSLGAGVQSTTLLLLSERGLLPRLDCAVFADTGWEPPEVYEHLAYLESICSTPIHRVQSGNLRNDILSGGFVSIPVFLRNTEGKPGIMRRQCTKAYKIRPIRQKLTALYGTSSTVEQWIGISWDEISRMRDSDVLWIRNAFPLVDRKWTRQDCLDWLTSIDVHPPRSACIGCPLQSRERWETTRANPVTWDDAVEVDEYLRPRGFYLHASLRPLTDWGDEQADMEMECEGYCGV